MATVKEIMEKKVITINEEESLEAACKILVSQRLSGIPVVDTSDNLVGFISERDIIQAVASKDFKDKRVSEVMTRKVVSIKEDTPVEQISQLFTERPFRYIPVIKSNKLVGIISRKDVINRLLGQYY